MGNNNRPRISVVSTDVELEQLCCLFLEYQSSVPDTCCFESFDEELLGLPGDYVAPRGCLLLAWRGKSAVGCVALRRVGSSNIREIRRLYVVPEHRRASIGRMLMLELIACSRTSGHNRLVLETLLEMQAARELYPKLGFRQIETDDNCLVPGALCFQLDLAAS